MSIEIVKDIEKNSDQLNENWFLAETPKPTMKQLIEDLKKEGIGAAMVSRATGISSAKFYNVLNDRATRFDTTEVEAVAKYRQRMLDASAASKVHQV